MYVQTHTHTHTHTTSCATQYIPLVLHHQWALSLKITCVVNQNREVLHMKGNRHLVNVLTFVKVNSSTCDCVLYMFRMTYCQTGEAV